MCDSDSQANFGFYVMTGTDYRNAAPVTNGRHCVTREEADTMARSGFFGETPYVVDYTGTLVSAYSVPVSGYANAA